MNKPLSNKDSFYKINNCHFLLMALFFVFVSFSAASLTVPAAARAAKDMELPETSYGAQNSTFKILVLYATRAGSTIGVSQAIGKRLAASGMVVDVKPVENVETVKEYHAVVLGSAIRRGAVLPELTDFVKNNKESLKNIPVACFIVCMILREDNEQNRAKAASYIKPLQDDLSFVDVGFFTGKLDYSQINFIDYIIIKYFIGTPEGDLRDWQKINDWAQNLGAKLKNR